jgi:8-oxo-dGTP diphosphatase
MIAARPSGIGEPVAKQTRSSARRDPEEAAFLADYRAEDFPRPSVTVDIVIFTILDADLKILLIRRENHPFKGHWALPGGFVRIGATAKDRGEDLDEAATRRLSEETGLPKGSVFLEQLHTFGRADRDPRTRVITVAYYALVRPELGRIVRAGIDTVEAGWKSVSEELASLELAFDHEEIITRALERVRSKLNDSNVAFELVPETFTIPELRAAYEVIDGVRYDPGNFRRRFKRMLDDGVIEKAPGKRITVSKPAQVYRFKSKRG